MPKSIKILLIAIAFGSIGSLFAGAEYLEWPLPGGLPFGNALTAIGLSSAAAAAFGLSQPGSLLKRVSVLSLAAAFAWLPVSIGLAGNLALNFSGSRGLVWIWLSLGTFAIVLCSLIWAIARWIFALDSNANSTRAA